MFTITRDQAQNCQYGPANALYLRGAKHGLRRLVKAPAVEHAVDLLCAARPQAIVVYQTSRKFQYAIVNYRMGSSLPAWQRCVSTAYLIVCRHCRTHFVDPRSVAAYRCKFCTQLGLVHAARSDDLQILLVPVEVRGDLEPDAIRIKK